MRYILNIAFILLSYKAYSCTCRLANISQGYTLASAIFYGKYLSTDTIHNFKSIYGEPFIVNNFEVTQFYSGVDSSTFSSVKGLQDHYVISLINSCNEACGICFEKEKMYLVYAYRDFYSGHLATDGCMRTRQIINEDFTCNIPDQPDYGKDERKVLIQINDTAQNTYEGYLNELTIRNNLLESEMANAGRIINTRTIFLYMTIVLSVALFAILLYKIKQNN